MRPYHTFERTVEVVETPDTLHELNRRILTADKDIKTTEAEIAELFKKVNQQRDYKLQLLAKKKKISKTEKTPLMHEAHALQLIDGAIS